MEAFLLIIVNLITAIIFYIIGRYAGQESLVVNKVKKQINKLYNKPQAGPINYPTPEEVAFRGSEEEKIDEEAKRLLEENGFK